MAQRGRDANLAQEAIGPECAGDFGAEDLEGDAAIGVLAVAGQKDRRHSAFAQRSLKAVPVGEHLQKVFGNAVDGSVDQVHIAPLKFYASLSAADRPRRRRGGCRR